MHRILPLPSQDDRWLSQIKNWIPMKPKQNISLVAESAPFGLDPKARRIADSAANLGLLMNYSLQDARQMQESVKNPFAPVARDLAAISDFTIPVRKGISRLGFMYPSWSYQHRCQPWSIFTVAGLSLVVSTPMTGLPKT